MMKFENGKNGQKRRKWPKNGPKMAKNSKKTAKITKKRQISKQIFVINMKREEMTFHTVIDSYRGADLFLARQKRKKQTSKL